MLLQLHRHPLTNFPSKKSSRLKYGCAHSPDGISAELLKFALLSVTRALHSIFLSVWRTGRVPSVWKDGIIITLYKEKSLDGLQYSYRAITLDRVFAYVLPERIQPLLSRSRWISNDFWTEHTGRISRAFPLANSQFFIYPRSTTSCIRTPLQIRPFTERSTP